MPDRTKVSSTRSVGASTVRQALVAGVIDELTLDIAPAELIALPFAVTDRISVVPAALISYGIDYYGVDGFNHVKVGLSLPIKLTSTATLTPYIAYNLPIDALDDLGEEDEIYGGVSLSVSF